MPVICDIYGNWSFLLCLLFWQIFRKLKLHVILLLPSAYVHQGNVFSLFVGGGGVDLPHPIMICRTRDTPQTCSGYPPPPPPPTGPFNFLSLICYAASVTPLAVTHGDCLVWIYFHHTDVSLDNNNTPRKRFQRTKWHSKIPKSAHAKSAFIHPFCIYYRQYNVHCLNIYRLC